eukprot:g15965.t1
MQKTGTAGTASVRCAGRNTLVSRWCKLQSTTQAPAWEVCSGLCRPRAAHKLIFSQAWRQCVNRLRSTSSAGA